MRAVVIALVVANVLLLAYGLFGRNEGTGPTSPEINAERIKVLTPNEARERLRADAPRACLDWGVFAAADAARAERDVEALGVRGAERRDDGAGSWRVYVAPQLNRRAAELVLDFLRKQGATDYSLIVEEPRLVNGVSLGIFSSEQAANARRDQMTQIGLRDVLVQPRELPTGRATLRLREVPAAALERLTALRGQYPGTEIRDCNG